MVVVVKRRGEEDVWEFGGYTRLDGFHPTMGFFFVNDCRFHPSTSCNLVTFVCPISNGRRSIAFLKR
jgi:hypothetical protein